MDEPNAPNPPDRDEPWGQPPETPSGGSAPTSPAAGAESGAGYTYPGAQGHQNPPSPEPAPYQYGSTYGTTSGGASQTGGYSSGGYQSSGYQPDPYRPDPYRSDPGYGQPAATPSPAATNPFPGMSLRRHSRGAPAAGWFWLRSRWPPA